MKNSKHLLLLVLTLVLLTGCSQSESNIENYLNTGSDIDHVSTSIMPKLNELPEYQNIEYNYKHKSALIFDSEAVVLVLEYDPETYEVEKSKLESDFTYLEEQVISDFDNEKYYIPQPAFSINNYDFKVVSSTNKDDFDYPKSFGMLATSDEDKRIAYLYYYDTDLDYIRSESSTPMAEFVSENFDYEF